MKGEEHLIKLAMSVWPFNEAQPYEMGVEQGVVWATAPGKTVGLCGYALIPAEGHPWSKQWPTGRDQPDDIDENRKWMRELNELTDAGVPIMDACTQLFEAGKIGGNREYMDDHLDVHGGVTWYTHPWVGFDTSHSGDAWDPVWDPKGIAQYTGTDISYLRLWTPELVAEEAKRLARQVAEVSVLERRMEVDGGEQPGGLTTNND